MLHTDCKFGEVKRTLEQIEISDEKVQFKPILNNENGGVVLVAFKAGQKLETHVAPAELMVNVLEGEIEFTVNGHPHIISAGEFLLVGADVPHSVLAKSDSKMMLFKVKP